MLPNQAPTNPSDEGLVVAPFSRRAALAALASLGAAAVLAACGSDAKSASTTASSADTTASSSAASTASTPSSSATTAASSAASTAATATADAVSCVVIPEETAGPYPGDGSNGVNVLNLDGVVRQDIRSSFGTSTTTAEGVPLTINLTIVDTANGCAAKPGAAVYLWHCDANGEYSLYSQNVQDENYLRGVQEADSNGVVSFTSIFPAAYSGRWPHIHFEVYTSLDDAKNVSNKIATSQVALPEDICELVYATDLYPSSEQNLSRTSLTTDNVFSDDGGVHELATVTGTVDAGFVASLTVPV